MCEWGLKKNKEQKTGQFELSKNDLVYKVFYFRLKKIAKKFLRLK